MVEIIKLEILYDLRDTIDEDDNYRKVTLISRQYDWVIINKEE